MNVVIHAGYFRTGTTTHQRHIFPNIPGVHYVGKPFKERAVQQAFRKMVCQAVEEYDEERTRQVLPKAATPPDQASARCTVISNELIISPEAQDLDVVFARAKSVFGPVRVLLTIRNQNELFKSWIGNVLPKASYGNLKEIVAQHSQFGDPRVSRISYLDFARYYEQIAELVGKDNVLILPFELLRKNPDAYASAMGRFLGVSGDAISQVLQTMPQENPSPRISHLAYVDFKKRYFSPRRHLTLDRYGSFVFRMLSLNQGRFNKVYRELREQIDAEFAPRNVALRTIVKDRIGIDIADLGYALPEQPYK